MVNVHVNTGGGSQERQLLHTIVCWDCSDIVSDTTCWVSSPGDAVAIVDPNEVSIKPVAPAAQPNNVRGNPSPISNDRLGVG